MSTKQKSVVIIVLVLAGAIALLWWRRAPVAHKPLAAGPAAVSAPAAAQTAAGAPAANDPAKQPHQPPATQKPSVELKRTFETLNHNEIEFYGRAVDQFGEPVPAAEVEGVVIVNTGTQGGEMHRKTTTNAQGYFQFNGFKGQDLGIGISKEGYEHRRHDSSFSYSYFEADHKRHIPDPKNPIVFTLWKKQGAEPLIHYEREWRFPVNAEPVKIDIVKGKMGQAEADLIISISRTPLNMRYGQRGFAWNASINADQGGLIRVGRQDYYNQAPTGGYEPHLEYVQESQSIRDAQEGRIKWTWTEGVSDIYYITSRDGNVYGRINLEIRPNIDRKEGDNQALVAVEVWLNPNGSRNLEFDPTKVIKLVP